MSNYKWVLFMEKEEDGKKTIHQVLCDSCIQGTEPSGEIVLLLNLDRNITVNEPGYEIKVLQ